MSPSEPYVFGSLSNTRFLLILCSIMAFACASQCSALAEETKDAPKPLKREDINLEIERCTRRIDSNPTNAENYVDRAVFRCHLDEFSAALEDLNKAVELDKKNDKAFAFRAIANTVMKHPTEALSDCVTALRINPRNLMARTNLPMCYTKAGDYRNAVVTGLQATQLEPENWIHWNHLCEAYLRGGRYQEAIACANRAIGRNVKMGEPYYWRSLAYDKTGQKSLAVQDRKHAKDLGYEPDSINVTMRENPPDKYKVERKEAIKHRRN